MKPNLNPELIVGRFCLAVAILMVLGVALGAI